MSDQCNEGTVQKQATASLTKKNNPLFAEAFQCQEIGHCKSSGPGISTCHSLCKCLISFAQDILGEYGLLCSLKLYSLFQS